MGEVPCRTSLVPLAFPRFVLCLLRVEREGLLDYQGRAGIISIVRWNLRPVIFGVENSPKVSGKLGGKGIHAISNRTPEKALAWSRTCHADRQQNMRMSWDKQVTESDTRRELVTSQRILGGRFGYFYFFCSGESEVLGGEGGNGFLLKIPEEGAGSPERGGGRVVGRVFVGCFFWGGVLNIFFGAELPAKNLLRCVGAQLRRRRIHNL